MPLLFQKTQQALVILKSLCLNLFRVILVEPPAEDFLAKQRIVIGVQDKDVPGSLDVGRGGKRAPEESLLNKRKLVLGFILLYLAPTQEKELLQL